MNFRFNFDFVVNLEDTKTLKATEKKKKLPKNSSLNWDSL